MGLLNAQLLFAVITSGFGSGFQHGYHTGVINIPYQVLRNWENGTLQKRTGDYINRGEMDILWGVTTSMMNVGGAFGGLLTGVLCNKFGPKGALLFNNIFVLIATLLMGMSKYVGSVETMIIGRFFIGVNCGLNAGLCPMYISEISPVRLRGGLATVYQLVITISILVSQVFGMSELFGTDELWPILFIIPVIISILQIICLLFCAESPRFLVSVRNDLAKAEKALIYLRKQDDVSEELAEIKSEDIAIKALPKVTLKDMVKIQSLRTPLIISIGCMLAQQLSGVNAVVFYSTQMFEGAGLTRSSAIYGTLCMSVVNVLMTVLSLFLVEIAGRKTLLLVGFGGVAVDTLLLTIALLLSKHNTAFAYCSIALIVIYMVFFAPGPAPIPWFLVAELFNQSARPLAVSLAVPTNWLANFLVTLTFPVLQGVMGPWVFLIFVVLNCVFFVFILIKVPETKNKTIEEITRKFE